MTPILWALLGYMIFSMCANIWLIGRKREPVTSGVVVVVFIMYVLLFFGAYVLEQ